MRLLTFFLLLFNINAGYSQDKGVERKPYKNACYLEAGGNAFLYSINYERRMFVNDKMVFTGRIGFATLIDVPFLIPVELNWTIGGRKHYFELGLGRTLAQRNSGITVARIGYRFESDKERTIFRIGYTPLFDFLSERSSALPWAGVSLGFKF